MGIFVGETAITEDDQAVAGLASASMAYRDVVFCFCLAMVAPSHEDPRMTDSEILSADGIADDCSTITDPVGGSTAHSQLHSYLAALGDYASTLAGFDDCVCGINFNGESYDVYYSLPAMILQLMRDSDMNKFDAVEFIQYNTVRSLDYEGGGIMIIDAAITPTISQPAQQPAQQRVAATPQRDTPARSSILSEQVMSLKEAAAAIEKITRRKPDKSTLYRWCTKGVKGKVLEHERIGGNIITSQEALERFILNTD